MALIACAECGGQVSDKATACPHCGAPIASTDIQGAQSVSSSDPENISSPKTVPPTIFGFDISNKRILLIFCLGVLGLILLNKIFDYWLTGTLSALLIVYLILKGISIYNNNTGRAQNSGCIFSLLIFLIPAVLIIADFMLLHTDLSDDKDVLSSMEGNWYVRSMPLSNENFYTFYRIEVKENGSFILWSHSSESRLDEDEVPWGSPECSGRISLLPGVKEYTNTHREYRNIKWLGCSEFLSNVIVYDQIGFRIPSWGNFDKAIRKCATCSYSNNAKNTAEENTNNIKSVPTVNEESNTYYPSTNANNHFDDTDELEDQAPSTTFLSDGIGIYTHQGTDYIGYRGYIEPSEWLTHTRLSLDKIIEASKRFGNTKIDNYDNLIVVCIVFPVKNASGKLNIFSGIARPEGSAEKLEKDWLTDKSWTIPSGDLWGSDVITQAGLVPAYIDTLNAELGAINMIPGPTIIEIMNIHDLRNSNGRLHLMLLNSPRKGD